MAVEEALTARDVGISTVPQGAPAHLEHLLDELNESLDLDAPGTSLRVLKRSLGFLAAYVADLVEGVASVFGELNFKFKARGEIVETVDTLRRGLAFLQSDAPSDLPEVRAFVDSFYEAGAPKKFARILELGGKPRRGTMALDRFLEAPIPVRKKCVQEVRHYTPYLREWLESMTPLFAAARIVSERTSLQGHQSIRVELGKQTIVAGKRIEVSSCPLCIPDKEIDVPLTLYERPIAFFVPQKSPRFLSLILDRLDEAMRAKNAVAGCLELRNALEFLIRYFAGVTSKVCEDLSALPRAALPLLDNSASIADSERLLNFSIDALRKLPDSLAAKTLTGIFYRRNEHFAFVPRWHTEILALHGQLSAWCQLEPGYGELEDPEACKLEFEKHVPTLREWLLALGGYLQSTEHFFSEPRPDGAVEFSLRIGDRFVEVGEPGYLLWLNNPRPEGEGGALEGEGESTFAAKPLIRESLEVPEGCPVVLGRILTRMDLYLRLGDPIESCASLRDALDYLTRYFAGVAAAAFRRLGTLPPEAEKLAESSLSINDCEKLLILALRSIGREEEEKLGHAVRNVFYYEEDLSHEEKPTGSHARLLALDADPSSKMQNLAQFCSLKAGEGVLSNPARSKRELERFMPTLQDWLAMAGPFFKECQHHEEPPDKHGRTELVIEYSDIYLELVAPDYTFYIRPGSDVVPDIDAPDLPPPDLVLDEDVVDVPTRKKSREEMERERPFLVHRVDLIGDRPNSKGKKCAAGYIVLTNAGGGTLSGAATTTDDCIEVEPPRFRGNKVQLSYWVDTDALPDTHEVFILLKTGHEERTISVYEMIGQARARPVSKGYGFLKLLAPNLLLLPLLVFAFHAASAWMNGVLTDMLGRGYETLHLVQDAPDAYGVVVSASQLVGYLYLAVAGMVPVLVIRTYRRLPPSAQELLERRRLSLMILPSIFVGITMFTPVLGNHFSQSSDFPGMDFYGMYLYFIGLNFASTYYQEMSLTQKLDDLFLNPTVRKCVTVGAWFIFLTTILLGVSA